MDYILKMSENGIHPYLYFVITLISVARVKNFSSLNLALAALAMDLREFYVRFFFNED